MRQPLTKVMERFLYLFLFITLVRVAVLLTSLSSSGQFMSIVINSYSDLQCRLQFLHHHHHHDELFYL